MRYVGYEQLNIARQRIGVPRERRQRLLLPGLMFLSVALLVLSRMNHSYVENVRWRVAELMTPVLSAVIVPLEPFRWAGRQASEFFSLSREIQRLRDENQRLKGWEWRANELERKFTDLAAASKTVRDTAIEFTTARVIANSSGAFVRSAIINAGLMNRIAPGHPVMSGDGLVGRVIETGANSSRVLLLTDANSRIPVLIGAKGVRAMIVGDNGAEPKLAYVAPGSEVKAGDEVSASGVGGLFPRGLRIGSVTGDAGAFRVRPHANLDALEYVSILYYETPVLDTMSGDPGAKGAFADPGKTIPPNPQP
jgi:rod shape-determining protein MreC